MAKKDGNFRAWLGLELAEDRRRALELWLGQTFDGSGVTALAGSDLILRVSALAGRHRGLLDTLIEDLRNLRPEPVQVELAAALRALPNRRWPRIYLLPARCDGLAASLGELAAQLPHLSGPVRAERVAPYLLVGRVQVAAEQPRHLPGKLPELLREPVDAVRLGLYCSQTTPGNERLDPLARVKLPAAAVR